MALFKQGHEHCPVTFHVKIEPRDDADNLLHHVSSAAAVRETRMECAAFQPDDVKNGFTKDAQKKQELLKVLAADGRNVTDKFTLGNGQKLKNVQIVLAWHGCNANIIDSILTHGFAAFSSLDPGFYGAGNYVSVEPKYACDYARGLFTDNPGINRQSYKKNGEYAILLVACILGFTYPITPGADKGGPGGHCKFYGKPLDAKYSSRLVAVSPKSNYMCEQPDLTNKAQLHEIVLKND